ncbi:HD domain-containing phosphohydrolase [Pseudonocardia sp.]|uniref:HD domain-containing phosphohydrolase n=1 Tax=Pseudonocardia sp. TaxID=60912 RepID=UPI003D149335
MAVTRAEIAALLAAAQDHAFGQPPGAQLRATVLGQHLARAAGEDLATTWWTSALRFLGCTGHAYDTAVVFGDEIELRARSLRMDAANPAEVLRVMIERAGPGTSGLGRLRAVLAVLAGGRKAAELNFRMACEVADALAARLGLDDAVRTALAANFERWNGAGLPAGARGTAIPRPMRVAQLAQELEVFARIEGIDAALAVVRRRRGRSYDPQLADLVLAHAAGWWAEVEAADPWSAALALAPPCVPLDAAATREALLVLADFADLKSPWFGGHSRAVAELAGRACGPAAEAAALLHDLGRVAVPNTVWDKPGPLTRDERDRVETHPLVTDQLLRRVPHTAALAATACAAHERLDGSGYHRRLAGAQLDDAQRVLAAADVYQALVSDRPHRAALAPADAAAALRAAAAAGRLDAEAVERVLAAAGHRRARPRRPAGLTAREVEVLRLLALGLTTRQVAQRLTVSPKTADHHVQHVYAKIGVSTRGAAALFAVEHGLLRDGAGETRNSG